jgi:glycosyltransferase involved in cell wall biosynthesis
MIQLEKQVRFGMKVSFTGAPEYMDRNVGYGEASFNIFNSLNKLGIECKVKSKDAPIGISFTFPDKYTFSNNQYKIGYTPWESTSVFNTWKEPLNNVIDELWTTSNWCAEMFSKHTNKPIFVYEHGVLDNWIPKKRELNSSRPFRFLHIGEPSFRKDGQMVVDAFINLFGDDPNYELILKCSNMNTTRIYDKDTGNVKGSPPAFYKNIRIIESYLSVEQVDGLYDLCDVVVYPSWGEGFGFIPLQGMAKGIPTICTGVWATYERYITMPIDSVLTDSPWPIVHPGQMFKPDYSQLKFYMKDVVENYDKYSDLAYKNSFLVHKDYNWDKVSKPAVDRLKQIQKF